MLAGLAVLAGLGLWGCGRSSLSDAQLRQAATRVCTAARADSSHILTPGTPAGAASFLTAGVRAYAVELHGLRRLRAAHDAVATLGVATRALAGELDLMRSAVRALSHGADPLSAVPALQRRLAPVESRGDTAWRALDLPACLSR
jgi:hypothetical protein